MLLATARFVITTIQRKFFYLFVFLPKVPRSIYKTHTDARSNQSRPPLSPRILRLSIGTRSKTALRMFHLCLTHGALIRKTEYPSSGVSERNPDKQACSWCSCSHSHILLERGGGKESNLFFAYLPA